MWQPDGHKHRIRMKVGEDVAWLMANHNAEAIYFCDALLPYYNAEWRESWGDLHIPFTCYIRADISESDLLWLIDRGMVACAFGVESGDEQFRNGPLNKGVSDAQIQATTLLLQLNNIFYMPFFMSGVPGDTWVSQTRSIKMIRGIGGHPVIWQYTDLMR